MQAQSASSTEVNLIQVSAPATFAQVREYAEYKNLAAEEATAIINDAVTTGTLLRSNGTALTSFPTYYQLRFIATQEGGTNEAGKYVDRGFHKATNARRVRAACLVVFENSPKPASNGDTTIRTKSAPASKAASKSFNAESVTVTWQGNAEDTLDYAFAIFCQHEQAIIAHENAEKKNAVEALLAKTGMSRDDLLALLAN